MLNSHIPGTNSGGSDKLPQLQRLANWARTETGTGRQRGIHTITITPSQPPPVPPRMTHLDYIALGSRTMAHDTGIVQALEVTMQALEAVTAQLWLLSEEIPVSQLASQTPLPPTPTSPLPPPTTVHIDCNLTPVTCLTDVSTTDSYSTAFSDTDISFYPPPTRLNTPALESKILVTASRTPLALTVTDDSVTLEPLPLAAQRPPPTRLVQIQGVYKPKWYTVICGRRTGIFNDWLYTNSLMTGIPSQNFRGFHTEEAAQGHYTENRG
ncbi:hypothetical protein PILCRDRAFT_85738 [Piloderma croceum F 1598]|uniref:Ribonuclease H1 N-terminal domain-containing protein n=1 Tax=Piloderma croceum (strain F 1598) TaxID=765440 RepID=A0A0C3FUB6_PILCF|nr:hypothetical protein PILCRDRAFT_85738 [Piloderma croceum F 1598]